MRRNFAQILKNAKIDIKTEYQKLYGMLYDRSIQVSNTKYISAYDELSDNFINFYFRGTCLSMEEFNDMHGLDFKREPMNFNINHLINLCEYMYNMLMGYQSIQGSFSGYAYAPMMPPPINIQLYIMQINQIIEKIGYMQANQDGVTIFVEKSPIAISVAESELIPENFSYRLICYHHHRMKGNLQAKKDTLLKFASILEAKRNDLKCADSTLANDLFYLFNNLNIRHNNTNPEDTKRYKEYVDQMPKEELEKWYDETYQMCLLAILQLEHVYRKQAFKELKLAIELSPKKSD